MSTREAELHACGDHVVEGNGGGGLSGVSVTYLGFET